MALEILRRASEVRRTGIMTPKFVADLPTPAIDFITHYYPKSLESLPGYENGDYFKKIYESNPVLWMPNKELMNSMLYAGERGTEGLKKRVYDRIRTLEVRFPSVGLKSYIDQDQDTRFNPLPILQILEAVEETMDGQNRRTGEDSFCHILRCVDRGIDYISLVNKLYRTNRYFLYFNPPVAEILLSSLALHDLSEEKRKIVGNVYKRGRVLSINDSWGKSGLRLETHLVKDDNIERSKLLKEYFIPFKSPYLDFLLESLVEVDTDRYSEDRKIQEVINQLSARSKKLRLIVEPQLLLNLIGVIVKDIDRIDNLTTYYFTKENGEYVLTKPEKLLNKTEEQLNEFAPLERYFMFEKAEQIGRDTLTQILGLEAFYHLYMAQYSKNTEILKMLPTRWASLTRLGVNPNLLYSKTPTWGTYSKLPLMI